MERLALDRFSSPWLRFQHLARYRWVSEWAPGKDVLDAACGTAYGARLLRDGGARSVTAIDLSGEAFHEARRKSERLPSGAKQAGLEGIRLARGDVARLPVPDRSVDLYASFETIEHIPDDRGALREAARVVRREGRFVCSTPNRNLLSPGNTLTDRPLNPFHIREYSIDEFVMLVKEYFEDVELFAQTDFSRAHHRLLERAGRVSNTLAVKAHQLRNLASIFFQSERRHRPYPMSVQGSTTIPEIVIAVCRNPV